MHHAITKGSVAVITGGASGIGLAAAHHLACRGLRICLADLAGERLETARGELVAAGTAPDDVIAVATDVGDKAELEALADRVYGAFGAVNVLLNNAGMQPGSSIFDVEGNWDRIIDVNLFGIVRGAQGSA